MSWQIYPLNNLHCESESLFNNELFDAKDPKTHSLVRNENSEIDSIRNQIQLANEIGFKATYTSATSVQQAVLNLSMKQNNRACGSLAE